MKNSIQLASVSVLAILAVAACGKQSSGSSVEAARSSLRCSATGGLSIAKVGQKFILQSSSLSLPFQFSSQAMAQSALDVLKAQSYSQLCQYGDGVTDFSYLAQGTTAKVGASEKCFGSNYISMESVGGEYVLSLDGKTISRLGTSVDIARGALNVIKNKNFDKACLIKDDTSGFVHFVNEPEAPQPQPTAAPDQPTPSPVQPEVHLRTNYGRVVPGASVILSWSTEGVSYCSLQILGAGGRNIGVERNAYLSFVINQPTRFQLSCKADSNGEYIIDYVFVDINRAPDRP